MHTRSDWTSPHTAPAPPTGPSLVRSLSRSEAYPTPRPPGVEVRQTHASWVFLTEDEAWKVKRPVDYGFLHYAERDQRRACCEEEVRLGRRLAPDVYRGVVPIFARADGLSFVGPGPVVDHAVRMRRLSDRDSAETLLGMGQLTPRHLQRVAERLAEFYRTSPETPELGAPDVLKRNIVENYRQSLAFAGRFVDRALLDRLGQWQLHTQSDLQQRLEARVASGKIRDGHGDLRLEHVYFEGGAPDRPLVLDPIEFNRDFRCADVALDVAFLAMELEARQRGDLAAWFLSSFARASNDYAFYPLVDLYLSYRAWVRAKVACFVAVDAHTPAAKASRKAREASRLFELAASYMDAPPRECPVVVIGGMIGAGKTTLGDALCQELRAPVISSDFTRKHLGGLAPRGRSGVAVYGRLHRAHLLRDVAARAGGAVVPTSGRHRRHLPPAATARRRDGFGQVRGSAVSVRGAGRQ